MCYLSLLVETFPQFLASLLCYTAGLNGAELVVNPKVYSHWYIWYSEVERNFPHSPGEGMKRRVGREFLLEWGCSWFQRIYMVLRNTSGISFFSVRMAVESSGFNFHGHAGKTSWPAGTRWKEQVVCAFVWLVEESALKRASLSLECRRGVGAWEAGVWWGQCGSNPTRCHWLSHFSVAFGKLVNFLVSVSLSAKKGTEHSSQLLGLLNEKVCEVYGSDI